MSKSILALIPAIAILLIGCGKQETTTPAAAPASSPESSASLPDGLILNAAPTGDVATIGHLKANGARGDDVVVKVFVGGRTKPIVKNLAVMTVVDTGLPNACTSEDDHCKTPWDYCCAGSDELAGAMASVRILDPTGNPLGINLADAGIKPGDSLLVAGFISDKNDAGNLVIDAQGIYRP